MGTNIKTIISPEFGELFLDNVNDPAGYKVHQMFNAWWAHAPEPTIEAYIARLNATPDQKTFLEARHLADPLELDLLVSMPEGSLGRGYHDFIVDNNLLTKLAIDYRAFHEHLAASGVLDRMPEGLQYFIIRGFQIHDLLHVLTGFDATPRGEIALQAFCLAQVNFPYFGMWIAHVGARMTYIDPHMIEPTMDAITEGWALGRGAENLQFELWENRLTEPLSLLRDEFGLAETGKALKCVA